MDHAQKIKDLELEQMRRRYRTALGNFLLIPDGGAYGWMELSEWEAWTKWEENNETHQHQED